MKKYLILTFSLFSVQLCAQYVGQGNKTLTDDLYYSPTPPVLAMFQNKQELFINAFALSSFGLSASYSISNHIGISGSYGHAIRDDHTIDNYELGVGYFNSFGRKKQWTYELSTQGLIGKSHIQLDSKNIREDLSYKKFSVQGVFGFRHKIVEVALSPRYCVFQFYDYERMYSGEKHPWMYGEQLNGETCTVLESNLLVRVGSPKLKFGMQMGVPAMLKGEYLPVNFYDRVNLIMSISYRVDFTD